MQLWKLNSCKSRVVHFLMPFESWVVLKVCEVPHSLLIRSQDNPALFEMTINIQNSIQKIFSIIDPYLQWWRWRVQEIMIRSWLLIRKESSEGAKLVRSKVRSNVPHMICIARCLRQGVLKQDEDWLLWTLPCDDCSKLKRKEKGFTSQ